jgi:hypothetical protein
MEASRKILYEKWTYQQVCEHYGWTIPQTTIWSQVQLDTKGEKKKPVGRPTKLTVEEERWLASWCVFCYAMGVPPRRGRVLMKAAQILKARGAKFDAKSGLPSYKWWTRFARRWSLKLGRSTALLQASAQGLSRESLDSFYDLLFLVISQHNIPAKLIWACDETGFSRSKAEGTVVMPKSAPKAKTVTKECAQHISLMSTGSAVGERMPLFLMLPGQGQRIHRHVLKGTPPDSAVCYTRKRAL